MNRLLAAGLCAARLLVGGLFVYAGTLKALDPQAFAGQVAAYGLFPFRVKLLIAATLPGVEILAGLLLVINRKVRPATLVILALTLGFLVLLGWAWSRGLQIDCGCFRPGETSSPRSAFFRDLLLFGLTLWVWLRHESPPLAVD